MHVRLYNILLIDSVNVCAGDFLGETDLNFSASESRVLSGPLCAVDRDRRTKSENADMKAETQNVDFDPLSLGEVLESSRFMLTMKMPFGTPKCHAKKSCFEQVMGQCF